mgnify:CR=1 FL=1
MYAYSQNSANQTKKFDQVVQQLYTRLTTLYWSNVIIGIATH